MAQPLIFILAPAEALPSGIASRSELEAAQRLGPAAGLALRLFSLGHRPPTDLTELPLDGRLTGEARRTADGCQLICDAVIPDVEPQQDGLAVYQPLQADPEQFACLDCLALRDLGSETCWFYPTHDGTYLSWQRAQRLQLAPGRIAEAPTELLEQPYGRHRLRLLWSLLADDTNLTCVGLTYGGQRIDWPIRSAAPEALATWSRFHIDSSAETSLVVQERLARSAALAPAPTDG